MCLYTDHEGIQKKILLDFFFTHIQYVFQNLLIIIIEIDKIILCESEYHHFTQCNLPPHLYLLQALQNYIPLVQSQSHNTK